MPRLTRMLWEEIVYLDCARKRDRVVTDGSRDITRLRASLT